MWRSASSAEIEDGSAASSPFLLDSSAYGAALPTNYNCLIRALFERSKAVTDSPLF